MPSQRIQAFSITDTGRKRSNNQDACAVFKKGSLLLMIVADGVGGNMCGEVASRIAVQTFKRRLDATDSLNPKEFLADSVREANTNIRAHVSSHPECKGMATTLTAAIIRFPELHLLQVGDSRAYLLRGKALRLLTEDQTLVRKMVKEGVLSPEEALTHPKRHVIINAMGISNEQKFDSYYIELGPNDQVLLCSDGLYDEVGEEEIRDILLANTPKEAIQRLVAAANAAGGKDNISITLAVADGRAMEGTKQFETTPVMDPHKKHSLKWLAILLCLCLLAGGAWYWTHTTESGERAKNHLMSLMGLNHSQQHKGVNSASSPPKGKP